MYKQLIMNHVLYLTDSFNRLQTYNANEFLYVHIPSLIYYITVTDNSMKGYNKHKCYISYKQMQLWVGSSKTENQTRTIYITKNK